MNEPDKSDRHPYWLWKTKRLFPHPLFAGLVSLACCTVGVLFAGVALNVAGCGFMSIPSAVFFLGAFATACAAFTRTNKAAVTTRHSQSGKPTFAVLVLLVGVYSWLLTLAMHLFDAFFKNGPGSIKYYVTLSIAVASTVFMKIYGNKVVHTHFGASGGRKLELSGRQALYVVVLVVFLGVYLSWLMH